MPIIILFFTVYFSRLVMFYDLTGYVAYAATGTIDFRYSKYGDMPSAL